MAAVLGFIDPSVKGSKKKAKVTQAPDEPLKAGIIYVGHIPHGFYEEEMKRFFSQFGHVKRVKLSRNKKVCPSGMVLMTWM